MSAINDAHFRTGRAAGDSGTQLVHSCNFSGHRATLAGAPQAVGGLDLSTAYESPAGAPVLELGTAAWHLRDAAGVHAVALWVSPRGGPSADGTPCAAPPTTIGGSWNLAFDEPVYGVWFAPEPVLSGPEGVELSVSLSVRVDTHEFALSVRA